MLELNSSSCVSLEEQVTDSAIDYLWIAQIYQASVCIQSTSIYEHKSPDLTHKNLKSTHSYGYQRNIN